MASTSWEKPSMDHYQSRVAKALAIYRIEKPRNPENRRKIGEKYRKILFFAPIFGLFFLFFAYFSPISGFRGFSIL